MAEFAPFDARGDRTVDVRSGYGAAGMPTHFDSASGEPVAIETHVHLLSEHTAAALGAGWELAELRERLIDDVWLELKPKWEHLRDQPVAFAFAWRR